LVQLTTQSAEETQALAARLGAACRGGELLLLDGDLGAGKTTFVQGLARGLGVPADTRVQSPSYALIHEHAGRVKLVHVDLYRLESEAQAGELGLDEIFDSAAVVAVEWPSRLGALAPVDRLEISLVADGDRRTITFRATGPKAAAALGGLA
jgi:tRNA threonylcarbamoyladenosine biosynthesis protein TsaE